MVFTWKREVSHFSTQVLFEKENDMRTKLKKAIQLIAVIVIGILMVATVVAFARKSSQLVSAAGPIPPPQGYPKLSLSSKVVTPTIANKGGEVLTYTISITNTGAYSASEVTLKDTLPPSTTLTGELYSSEEPKPVFAGGMVQWGPGVVGFDTSVVITFSVTVAPGFEGTIRNTAVISDPMIAAPVAVSAETNVTDQPVFEISKSATPALPGKNKPLTYNLVVTNVGQDAVDTPIVVTDLVPAQTTFLSASDGGENSDGVVTWERSVDLSYGETSEFTFSVKVGDVPSGTVISNDTYAVMSPVPDVVYGEPYTTTVIDPIFILSKSVDPDPPGSNREMTYTLTVLNLGSKATDLVITDVVPAEVDYVRGGESCSEQDQTVTCSLPSLDTRESAQVTFTVMIGDIADLIVLNGDYQVCSAEDVCAAGIPTPSYIVGPTFEATAVLDPIAKGTGGGTKTVTPTLTVKNIGPGNAIDALAVIKFGRISISEGDLIPPPTGSLTGPVTCYDYAKCSEFRWTGDMSVGDVITFTTFEGQSTIGGEQGTHYTATVVITDALGMYTTEPVTGTAIGEITHFANLIPTKSAPAEIGPGQTMTYTIQVFDSAYTTEMNPPPVLTETVPASLTLLTISDGGTSEEVDGKEVITWKLTPMGPGDYLFRSFKVQVDPDVVSGTLIVNDDYRATWYESENVGAMSNLGMPITTTVREVGLIDSYKTVTPVWALPGEGTVLTYTLHVVNSGPYDLSDVQVSDIFPWENTTYQRDAVASGGKLSSDIVSLVWDGDVDSYSEQLITFTVVVDDFFEGVVTNTATISHPSLKEDKVVTAVAYITDKPVLFISKKATPDPVSLGSPLLYQVKVTNLGQQATLLTITDTVPLNTTYVFGSASSGGQLVGDTVEWKLPVLDPGESLTATYLVTVNGGMEIINEKYVVRCQEGVVAVGKPVITQVRYPMKVVRLPLVMKH
jgi:uncharacterized repeat protein (TIGR01451 family)